jgi:hypothetical protein
MESNVCVDYQIIIAGMLHEDPADAFDEPSSRLRIPVDLSIQ